MNPNSSLYNRYVTGGAKTERESTINDERRNLIENMIDSPDYHPDSKRNGRKQGMLFTRGGEKHTYNVICKPGDELFAGDIIDAFDSKWIVMESRADETTHKTGIMQQCNYIARFQNHSSEIHERYGFLDISGYSSSFNNNVQLQKGEEQVVIYLPYDKETAKIFVDKRLPSHRGFDPQGKEILFTFNVTGVNPVSGSYNNGDHIIMLKAVRGLYAPDKDNLELGICDYIAPDEKPINPNPPVPGTPTIKKLKCEITGKDTIRIGTTRSYHGTFYTNIGIEDPSVKPLWMIDDNGATINSNDTVIKIHIDDDPDRIGDTVKITLCDADDKYEPCVMEVEVIGIG